MTRLVSTAKGIGRLEDDGETVALLDLDAADLGAALQAGLCIASIATASVRDRVPVAQAQLIAPVPRPSKIWAVGYAYAGHRTEVGYNGVAEEPVVFLKAPSSVIGTGGQIRFPEAAPDEVDYEGELAVVIGRRATDVSEAEAYAFVAGFTIVNDVSARDVQKGRIPGRAANVTAAKSFDTFTPMGPALATLDEFADPDDLHLRTWVDDELRQDARTSQLIHPVPVLVSYVSRQTALEPGDVIATGTPAGVGHKQGRFLQSGTEVRIEIEGIGSLANICA
ncbi:fumarylacetoacetate hydrolase family protein [Streptomyces sp. NBC_01795]|uniref:fumarylacetoacetate hydrolase family protein n=1 Tax=unclassified Streptomyces TaxID=2593676 RepID=UPI002DDB05B0|nr:MULTISPECIES: fumarylacetoacetate hydrolase family protein [unclassified Streptomyces]WSA90571.1 fumarylacetoacetate hydrolase family protein [Streptomyces sp. NBC_01795]WSB74896.1 fumarylacetoacetate hydrolase family protein [Streptomyces sp. NBC_01775]WSS16823.1 fumarylacetoacetate hydrolase family protein [Streptomyces sp. NBC_01186]